MPVKAGAYTSDPNVLIPAAAYYRYSSHGQTEQSIEGQQSAAHAYAAAHGYKIVCEYIDRAMTGRNDDREDFQRMLADVPKHQFKVIILWKVDRFGRNREEIAFNKYHCKKHGVQVEYVAENIPSTPEGVILESVLEGMAEYFSLQLSQNVRRGLKESAKRGQVTGNTPLGYMTGPDKRYTIDPARAPIVQEVFRRYAAGETTTEIINSLNERGLRTQQKRPFTKNSLRTMLSNKKYIGIYTYGDIVLEDAIPPLIDLDTYQKVQDMLKINRTAPAHKWTKAEYLLTGKLFCGHCGTPMQGESGTSKSGGKYTYYLCAKHKKKEGCPKKAVRQSWIEELVLKHTIALLHNDALLEYIADQCWALWEAQDESKARIASSKARLEEVDKGIAHLVRAIESGVPSGPLTARMEELTAEKTALEKVLSKEEALGGVRLTKAQILYFLHQFRDLDTSDLEAQKRLIEVFINSVFVYDDRVTLTFNYSGNDRTVTLVELDEASVEGCSDAALSGVPKRGHISGCDLVIFPRRAVAPG